MFSRLFLIFSCFCVFTFSLVLRTAYLQFDGDKRISALKKRQFKTKIKINSERGRIQDRHKTDLAVSVSSYSLYAIPSQIENKSVASKKLSKLLKMKPKKLRKKLSKKNFSWIKRQLPKVTRNKILKMNLKGFNFIEEPKRIYPHERLLSQTLGFTGIDNKGLEGLEFKYEKTLSSKEGKSISILRDARGRPLVSQAYFLTQSSKGDSLVLTIDKELQFFLEQALETSLVNNKAKSALGLILDANNSEILALANLPSYDINKALKAKPSLRRNAIIASAFEPGSTLKSLIVAIALEKKFIKANTRIDCENGSLQVDDRIIKEALNRKYGNLTISDILKNSSNICLAKIGFQLGDKLVYDSLREFGFGKKTNIDLPGEHKGILKKPPWRLHHLGNISFGQGVSVTAIQLTNAYAALINGGFLNTPYIIKSSIDGKTGAIKTHTPEKNKKRILSQETSELMRLILSYAAPSSAHVNGFPVGGKTGTAQKADPVHGGYKKDSNISSFIGFLPAHKPKFVIYIAIDEPEKNKYGSQAAAPVFSEIASYMVRKENLNPVFITQPHVLKGHERSLASQQNQALQKLKILNYTKNKKMPYLYGFSLKEAYEILKTQDLKIKIKGSGFITKTNPIPGSSLEKRKSVELIFE